MEDCVTFPKREDGRSMTTLKAGKLENYQFTLIIVHNTPFLVRFHISSLLPTISHQSVLLTGPLTKLVSVSFAKNENSVHFMPAVDYSFHTSSQR